MKRLTMLVLTAFTVAGRVAQAAETGPLAPTLQGKAVVAQIHADWCPVCKAERPTIDAVRAKYGKNITYVAFDVTNGKTANAAADQAKHLGLSSFFNENKSRTGTIAIINPKTAIISAKLYNETDEAEYDKAIDAVNKQLSN